MRGGERVLQFYLYDGKERYLGAYFVRWKKMFSSLVHLLKHIELKLLLSLNLINLCMQAYFVRRTKVSCALVHNLKALI